MRELWEHFRLPILLGLGSVLCIITALIILLASVRPAAPIEFSSDTATVSGAQTAALQVDVAGAVVHPGVYQLPFGSRIEDAIIAAGGLHHTADEEMIAKSINRAAKLSDGAKLYIPAEQYEAIPEDQPQSISSTGNGYVSINTASSADLEELSGVGPVTAQKIIAGRPYLSLEELVSKKALGQSLFEKLKTQLSL